MTGLARAVRRTDAKSEEPHQVFRRTRNLLAQRVGLFSAIRSLVETAEGTMLRPRHIR